MVVAPEGVRLDQIAGDFGFGEVSMHSVEGEVFPDDAAGLMIYARDAVAFERDVTGLVREALEMGVPVLGSNGGMHLLNVALGGDEPIETPTHVGSEDSPVNRKPVFLAPGAKVCSTIGGSGWLGFPCDHRKGIPQARLAPDLMVAAMADDRVVEAFEMPGHRWVIGVQWDVFGAKRLPRGFDAILLAFLERVMDG